MSARGINRRALLSGAAAALAFSALPLQLPSADARKSPDRQLAMRRYRKLRRLLRKNPKVAGAVHALLTPSTRPGGYLRLGVTHPRKRSSWISSAHAQTFVLEPVVVIAPLSFADYSGFGDGPNQSSQGWGVGQLAAYNSYIHYYLPMIAAQNAAAQAAAEAAAAQAALVNVMVVPPPEPEPTIIPPVVEPEPEPPQEPSISDPLRDNPYAQYVASALEDVGLTLAEAFALAFFVGEAGGVLADAIPALLEINVQAIATEMAAGNLIARIALTAAGFTVQWIVVGGVLLGVLAVIGITLYYVLPEIDRQRRANVSDFAVGEVTIEAAPVASEPEPEPEPVNNFPDYPWWWDEENGAWVYIGE